MQLSQQGEVNTTQTCIYLEIDFMVTYQVEIGDNISITRAYLVFFKQQYILGACVLIDSLISGVCVLWLNRSCILHVLPHYLHMAAAKRAPRHFHAARISKVKHARASIWYIMKGIPDGIFFLRAHLNLISWKSGVYMWPKRVSIQRALSSLALDDGTV